MSEPKKRPSILIVEDDRDIRESLAEVLEDEGYSVASAADGLRALEYLSAEAEKPDLILLDLMMPNMNGFQFREEQLKSAEHARIPVAVLSADSDPNERAGDLNVAGYVKKPLKINALLELVRGILGT